MSSIGTNVFILYLDPYYQRSSVSELFVLINHPNTAPPRLWSGLISEPVSSEDKTISKTALHPLQESLHQQGLFLLQTHLSFHRQTIRSQSGFSCLY
jgi:hypothetical protein